MNTDNSSCVLANSVSQILHDEIILSQIRSLSSFIPSNQHIYEVSTRLCQDALHFQFKKSDICTKDLTWLGFIDKLWSHLLDPDRCMDVFHYYENGWNPQVFHWPLWSRNSYFFEILKRDELWLNEWINPLLAGANYAPMTTPLTEYNMSDTKGFNKKILSNNFSPRLSFPQTLHLRDDRVMHVYHFFVLHMATSRTVLPRNLHQIIEYGGGTGDNIPMLREMGFKGLHVVFDFMPMLIVHQFFLRISHWPAYYADDFTSETLDGRKTLLVSCDEGVSRLTSLLDHSSTLSASAAAAQSTLFLATWSLSETSLDVREKVLRQVIDYGVKYILLVFQRFHGDRSLDNCNWAKDLANTLYNEHGYEVCSWRIVERDDGHFYFIAVKMKTMIPVDKDTNTAEDDYLVCSAAVGCSKDSLLIVSTRCKILGEE